MKSLYETHTGTLNPETAWAPFEPSSDHPWNRRLAAHLFRRAGFAATDAELSRAVEQSPGEVVDQLLNVAEDAPFLSQTDSLAAACLATGNPRQLSGWWAWRMLNTPAPLLEKTTLFWHGHFATSAAKVEDAKLMLAQNNLLRQHAFGPFAELVREISRDPAMLIYLDSATNRKAHPNENYAREVMELFCLGEGNYSEQDIRELARCFTGWEVKREKFRFNRYQHDTGTKSILGQSGPFDGDDGVRIVLEQNAAPEFLVGRLIRYFVFDEPAATTELTAPLVNEFRESDLTIRPVLRTILTSNLMFSDQAVGRRIRSPAELAIGLLKAFEGSTNTFELAEALDTLGQGLFYPPSVKGWDGGRTWINSSTLLGRSNLVRRLLENEHTRFGRTTPREYFRAIGATSRRQIVDTCEDLLFAVPIPELAKTQVVALMESHGNDDRGLIEGLHALFTLPEFQLA